MTTAGELASAHTAATQVIARRAAEQVQNRWRTVGPDQLAPQYRQMIAPLFIGAIMSGQLAAAALAQPYVDSAATGTGDSPVASVVPASFAGMTAGGLPLDWLAGVLYSWLTQALGSGMSTQDASTAGLQRAIMYVSTEINDASRAATQVAVTAHPAIAGYERVVHLPACDRCIVLAGKFYRYSSGFLRHPRCDCTMRPVTQSELDSGQPQSTPRQLFDAMTPTEQNQRFGTANAETIRLGGDISQIVNARQGMSTIQAFGRSIQITSSGTTKRALFGGYEITAGGELRKLPGNRYRTVTTPRLTPGEIFRLGDEFGWTRDELIRQLQRYAYLR